MNGSRRGLGSGILAAAAIGASIVLAPCARTVAPVPVSVPVAEAQEKIPVVFVPGVTGVELRDRDTQTIYWGAGRNLLGPRDRGYREARPLGSEPASSTLEPGRVILRLTVAGVFRKLIYQPLVDLFEAHGYQFGDLASPRADENFFLFAYDWRQDNLTSVRLLADQLEGLRRRRGVSRLPVTLLCQSNGSHICRYFAKFRDLTLDQAEAGQVPESMIDVVKIGLIGSSNGGSLRILRELNRGRKYISGIGRTWSPEVLFTFVALLQDLPTYTDDLFVDGEGERLDVDLFDAANWQKYGWSIYGEGSRHRLSRHPRDDLFAEPSERLRYLDRVLARTERIQRLLRSDLAEYDPARLYIVQNSNNATPRRAVIARRGERWETLFADDRGLRRLSLASSSLTTPGDGHATLESQLWLSPPELARLVWDPVDVAGNHFEMILEPAAKQEILRIVGD